MMYITGLIKNESKGEVEFTQQTIEVAKLSFMTATGRDRLVSMFYCTELNNENECAKFMMADRGFSILSEKP